MTVLKDDGSPVEPLPVGAPPSGTTAETPGWIASIGHTTGGWMADNPVKSTIILTVTGGILKERVVDRVIDWVVDWGKGLFAAGAEKKVEEAIASESGAIANATGMDVGIGLLKVIGSLFKVAP